MSGVGFVTVSLRKSVILLLCNKIQALINDALSQGRQFFPQEIVPVSSYLFYALCCNLLKDLGGELSWVLFRHSAASFEGEALADIPAKPLVKTYLIS